jgi:hypothetical protein
LAVEKSLYCTFLCYLRSCSGLKDVYFLFSNHLKNGASIDKQKENACLILSSPYNWLRKSLLILAKRSLERNVYCSYQIAEGYTDLNSLVLSMFSSPRWSSQI